MKSLKLLALAALCSVPALGQPQPAGPPPIDEALAAYASDRDAVRLPDGRMLNFVCMGQGSPTVILTAGLGDFGGTAWAPVQDSIAKTTRVCAWDRPGFGLSDGSADPQTVGATTADLEAALATGRIPGPYVMVGHSMGSYESMMFTDRHRDQVAGMVLVDPSYPDQVATMQRLNPQALPPPAQQEQILSVFRTCAADIRSGTLRAGSPDPNRCVAYPPVWPAALRDALTAKVLGNPLQYEAQASFLPSMPENSRLAINAERNYGDLPLVVLTATVQPAPPNATPEQLAALALQNQEWNNQHDALAALSTRGVNARVPGANHYIQRSKPQVVIDAVEAVVAEARAAAR
jgi:pimeloyl-ACP methyl ester carboxylesterase